MHLVSDQSGRGLVAPVPNIVWKSLNLIWRVGRALSLDLSLLVWYVK